MRMCGGVGASDGGRRQAGRRLTRPPVRLVAAGLRAVDEHLVQAALVVGDLEQLARGRHRQELLEGRAGTAGQPEALVGCKKGRRAIERASSCLQLLLATHMRRRGGRGHGREARHRRPPLRPPRQPPWRQTRRGRTAGARGRRRAAPTGASSSCRSGDGGEEREGREVQVVLSFTTCIPGYTQVKGGAPSSPPTWKGMRPNARSGRAVLSPVGGTCQSSGRCSRCSSSSSESSHSRLGWSRLQAGKQ